MIPWAELNDEQRQAVEAWNEPLLVMAPVGTGKTNVLALRAAHAVEQGLPPAQALCLSFTNKAARELKSRLQRTLGRASADVTAKTFHGLCAQILRAEATAVGWDRDFVIYDEEDARTLCGKVAERFGITVGTEEKNQFEFLLFQAAAEARLSPFDHPPGEKPQAVYERCLAASRLTALKQRRVAFQPILAEYMHALRERHAVDFADLIQGVNRLWLDRPDILGRWRARYAWIQVDEVQDTTLGEYLPLRMLAEPNRNLSFFGDVDQTVYQWRGSAPQVILDDYRERFAPVREIHFARNYRSTRRILEACERLIRACAGSVTRRIIPDSVEVGAPIEYYEAAGVSDEAQWIAQQAHALHANGLAYGDMAVLARTNFTTRDLSREFTALHLPHIKVDETKFFQRAEIKDALAHLRLLVNRHDLASLARYVQTPPKGIGEATIDSLQAAPREAGLKLGDLLLPETYKVGDPFLRLIEAARDARVVVFDLETTGLTIGLDEIVEIAAARPDGETFHAYLKPSQPVGPSEHVHHLSDAFLAANGEEPREAVERFRAFCDGCVLAGHNVPLFDVPMLESVCPRLGLAPWPRMPVFDTLDLTRRYYRFPRYTLGEICTRLGLQSVPTHRADADVAATLELLSALMPKIEGGLPTRVEAIKRFGPRFQPLARQMESWREHMHVDRPHELLERVLTESGLLRHYDEDEERINHLLQLVRHFERFDEPELQPADALLHVLGVATLAREVDSQRFSPDEVALLTVHQAKGLEFDTVFIAGCAEGEFPNRRSLREGLEAEEHRLFYVALSRAKRRLFLSYPLINGWGREQLRSRYLRYILG